tara:strand:+ start:148 stop:888 length:741 start_codon:yes stop_codon:yes gene_type:complete
MTQKICPQCKKEFVHTSNRQIHCSKECYRQYNREKISEKVRKYYKEYYKKNRKKVLLKNSAYNKTPNALEKKRIYEKSPKGIEARKKYQGSDKSRIRNLKLYYKHHDKNLERKKKYFQKLKKDPVKYAEVRKRVNLYTAIKRRNNPHYRVKQNLSRRLRTVLKLKNSIKSESILKIIGCSVDQLKKNLEKKFKKNMNWGNYGKWHVDHIRPCASFDLTKPKQQKMCFHYTNLQPLWAEENLKKSNK